VKRALLAAFVLAALVGAVYAFLTLSREQSYRRLIAAGFRWRLHRSRMRAGSAVIRPLPAAEVASRRSAIHRGRLFR